MAPSSSTSSFVGCVAQGDDTEIDYVVMSSIHHKKTEILLIGKSVDDTDLVV